MSDDNTIPSAYETTNLDRGELTVSGRKKEKQSGHCDRFSDPRFGRRRCGSSVRDSSIS